MNLPRLLTNDGKGIQKIINPMHVSLELNIVPLSYASIRLSKDEFLPARGLVELFSPYGSVGVFRVRNPQDAYGDEMTTAELEHSIAEVGDYLVKEKIDEMMSADSAMKKVFSYYKGKLWKLGSVSALGTEQIALSVNYTRVLDSMLAILEQKKDCMMDFDFSTTPWTVKIVKKGTSVQAEGRLARNVNSARVSYDDTETCTRVFWETVDKKGNSKWHSRDANTISQYGIIEKEISVPSNLTDAEIDVVVNTYLNEHKNPRVGAVIDADELSSITGESMDKFAIGKKYRLAIPKYNVVLEDIIVSMAWDDLYGRPKSISVSIGDSEDTVVTFIHNLDSKGGGGGGGGGGSKKKEEDTWRRFIADSYKTEATIGLYALEQDREKTILKKAGLDVNPDGVLIYSKKVDKDGSVPIYSYINTLQDSIELKVNKNGVISAINMSPESITIQAKKINLEGYVTASNFSTVLANLYSAHINRLYVDSNLYYPNGLSYSNGVWWLDLTLSGNTYTLTENKLDGSTRNVGSFSRATTLTGAWSSGNFKVTASPQGVEINSGGLTSLGGQAHRDGDLLYVPINAGTKSTGYEAFVNWKNLLTSHSNCVAGLTRYNTDRTVELFRKISEGNYTSVGSYYWYRKSSNSALTTYYN